MTTETSRPQLLGAVTQRGLGNACIASGVLGVAAGVATLAYPDAVPDTQWSYPFSVSAQWAVSVVLAVSHALTGAGFLGVLRAGPHRSSRTGAIALWAAIIGYAGLAVCELLSGAIGGRLVDSPTADTVSNAFGVASMLTAIGSVVAGIVIARAGVWTGLAQWIVLGSGVVMIVVVTPAIISGDLVPRTVALMLWSLVFLPLGQAVRGSQSATAR